jgi:hypothetical protein
VIDYFVSATSLLFEIGDVLDRDHRGVSRASPVQTLDQFDLQGN